MTWQSSGQDGSGWGVYSREFSVETPLPVTLSNTMMVVIPDPTNGVTSSIVVKDPFIVQSVTVTLTIPQAPHPTDLMIWLTSPLSQHPDPTDPAFDGFVIDQRAPVIPAGAVITVPFAGQNAQGTWTLHIRDVVGPRMGMGPDDQWLDDWTLTIQPAKAGPELQVNTTAVGDQMYPSVAMATMELTPLRGAAMGPRQTRSIRSGVFYQRFDATWQHGRRRNPRERHHGREPMDSVDRQRRRGIW